MLRNGIALRRSTTSLITCEWAKVVSLLSHVGVRADRTAQWLEVKHLFTEQEERVGQPERDVESEHPRKIDEMRDGEHRLPYSRSMLTSVTLPIKRR